MCGLGFIGDGNEADLKNMIEAIRHRGPDSQGIFLKIKLPLDTQD